MTYNVNGLLFWAEEDILLRNQIIDTISQHIKKDMMNINPAWTFMRIEAPILTPLDFVNKEYSANDYYVTDDFALRPETTAGSFAFLKDLLSKQPEKWQRPPVCIWQAGKSFRKEQDQPTKFCRFKEFYQLEFQCVYSESTMCDYQEKMMPKLQEMFSWMLKQEVTIVNSDRLPCYSEKTIDLETEYQDRNMEIASVSVRNDYGDGMKVLEIAIGLDRLVKVLT